MKVLYFVDYPTSGWERDVDFSATQFIKTLKGKSYKAREPNFSHNGIIHRWKPNQQNKVIEIFSGLAATGVKWPDQFIFVPLPSSACSVGSKIVPLATTIASAIESKIIKQKVIIKDILRWDVPLRSAHSGGPRMPHELYPHVRHTATLSSSSNVVLIDDVFTSGGHVRACAAYLRDTFGVDVVGALCVGRTQSAPSQNPFSWRIEEVLDYKHQDGDLDLDWLK